MTVVRRVVTGMAAAVAAGLVLGAVARLMMRLATLAAGEDGEFSLAATAGILLVFVIATVPGAILALPFLTLRIIPMRGRAAA